MNPQEKTLSEKESLELIGMMISKANNAYHDTGISAMMWGVVITVCSLVKWSELTFGFNLPFDIYWLTLAAVVPQIFIVIREKRASKVKTYDEIYMDYLWLGFGISIFLMSFIVNAVFKVWVPVAEGYSQLSGNPQAHFSEFVSPLFLLLYGIPTFVTGTACKFRPMLVGGLLCWVCCIITIYTTLKTDLLLTAFSAVFAWLVPGIIMEKDFRKAKRELAAKHV